MDCERCIDADVDGGEALVVFVIGVLEVEDRGGENGIMNIGRWWGGILGCVCGEEFLSGGMRERHGCLLGSSWVEIVGCCIDL